MFNNMLPDTLSAHSVQRDGKGSTMVLPLIDEYNTYLEVNHRKRRTILQYRRTAEYLLDHIKKDVKDITKNDVLRYVAHLNQTYKQNTVTSYIQGLNQFLKYLGLHEQRVSIPQWENAHRDTITKEEIQDILRYARLHLHTMEYIMVLFITDLDCRPHEIALTQWDWIRGNKIYFNGCKTGNTYSFLTDELKTNLNIWQEHQKPKSKYVFTNQRSQCKGKPLSINGWKIRDVIKKITKKIVGRELNPQDFRASVITEEFNSYINPKTIQRKARHGSFKSTMKYNHVDDKELVEYLSTGTIFNTESISMAKQRFPLTKASCINNYSPSDLLREKNKREEDDTSNGSYSFSLISFIYNKSIFSFDHIEQKNILSKFWYKVQIKQELFSLFVEIRREDIGLDAGEEHKKYFIFFIFYHTPNHTKMFCSPEISNLKSFFVGEIDRSHDAGTPPILKDLPLFNYIFCVAALFLSIYTKNNFVLEGCKVERRFC